MEKQNTFGEATIPPQVFVRCPMVAWKLRQAKCCDGCANFHGLTHRMQSDKPMPFEHEFAVRCAFPVDRELFAVEIEGLNG